MYSSFYDFREDVVMVWQKGSFAVDGKIKLKAPTLPFECFFFFSEKKQNSQLSSSLCLFLGRVLSV